MLTRPNPVVMVFFALLLACLVALPFFTGPYPVKLMTRIVILATFVLSLDLLIGVTGLVSFGHAAFFGCGAYAVYFVSPESEAANVFVTLGAGLLAGGLVALIVGAFATLTRGFYFIMVTLAAGQMLFALFHDTDIAKGSDGAFINVKPELTMFGVSLLDFSDRRQFYFVCIAVLVGVYFLLFALVRSPFGRVLQGIRANEVRMSSLGYNAYRYKLAAFTLAGMLAGLAGALFASIDGFVTPDLLNWHQSGLAIMMVVLGGAGTLFGPILGALAYSSLEELLKTASIVGPFVADHWRLGTGATLIVAVLISPDGLAGLLRWKQARQDRAPVRPVDIASRRPARVAKTLSTEGLSKNFDGVIGVDDVSVRFEANMVHAIIGPNGAGKTTFTNLLSGALPATTGSVRIDDLDVTGWPAHRIARAGLGRSYQRTNIFQRFTVRENCALAAQLHKDALWRLRDGPYRAREDAAIDRALGVAGLADRANVIAGRMSNGEQRQLEIAMLIASGADLLILDEPLAGMGPEETQRVVALLRDLVRDHTIIVIEHDMDAVFAAADTLTVLVQGKLFARGRPDEIRSNEAVLEAYLGHHARMRGAA
ncbi:branched-chain amino acid ABC transporter ATP-binding protein/permease [Rhodopseudomonas sp. NSM]|uniref:branched-chain amino acid ABC transporter ATP-binding protein/permease n=1 Tax=Rhodopseudomonas sp. NSM TaxID=3457630 RepID=UPI004036E65F